MRRLRALDEVTVPSRRAVGDVLDKRYRPSLPALRLRSPGSAWPPFSATDRPSPLISRALRSGQTSGYSLKTQAPEGGARA
jgi:hypothetical protein